MEEYNKIETVFERDMQGSKKLIDGKFRNPIVEYLKDNEWIFTEKIDGTNIRVHWDGHNVIFGGRTDSAQIPSNLVQKLNSLFLGITNEQIFEQKFGGNPVTIYGEGYGAKIQAGGGLYSENAEFIAFDVKVGDIYLDRQNAEEVLRAFNIPMVPIIQGIDTIQKAVDYVKSKPNSLISKQTKEIEGVVGVPKIRLFDVKGDRIIVKVKVRDFVE